MEKATWFDDDNDVDFHDAAYNEILDSVRQRSNDRMFLQL